MLSAPTFPMRSYPFYSLTKGHKYIRPDAKSYWRHLTVSSHEIYNVIYNSCKDPKGRVPCKSSYVGSFPLTFPENVRLTFASVFDFTAQFHPLKTPPNTIERVWSRLLTHGSEVRNSVHPKGFAMAALYMLHIESFYPEKKPLDNNKMPGLSTERRELLKRFGNWVPCCCDRDCRLEWNFGNDVGLHRGGDETLCAIMKIFGEGITKVSETELEFLKMTKERWETSRASH
jgi:hypothetical protein